MSKPIQRLNIHTLVFILASALLTFLALRALLFLDIEGSPFPHMDDWLYQKDISFWTAVSTPNNENFQVYTNALYWLAPRLNIPFWILRYVSFALYILMLFMLYARLKTYVPKNRRFLLLLAFTPCFSAYMCGNLLWTSLIQIWIFFGFILVAVKYGFELPQTPKNQLLTFIFLLLSVIAMNMTLALIFAVLYFLRTLYLAKKTTDAEFSYSVLNASLMIIISLTIFNGIHHADASAITYRPLFTASYWLWLSYGLTGVLNGFRISYENASFYYITGAILALWTGFLLLRQIKTPKNHTIIALAVMLLASFGIITLLRQEHILAINWHTSRHIIYSIFLIPTVYALGANDKLKTVRIIADILLLVILLNAYPIFNNLKLRNNFGPERVTDVCLVQNAVSPSNSLFHCHRSFFYLNALLPYFMAHDAAFKSNNKFIYRLAGKRKILPLLHAAAPTHIRFINHFFTLSSEKSPFGDPPNDNKLINNAL